MRPGEIRSSDLACRSAGTALPEDVLQQRRKKRGRDDIALP